MSVDKSEPAAAPPTPRARVLPSNIGWRPCSDRSRERHDPLGGTGSRGSGWFLVEVSGPWRQHALLQSRLDSEVGLALVRRVEAAGMRPLAIRRTGRRAQQQGWRWAIVNSEPGQESVRWGRAERQEELLEVPLDGSTGVASDRPIVAVCTHARHDQCCAVRGRPVVNALAEAFPEETWECSHLGGDRFAATMVLLPHGLYYGRVPADSAVDIVRRYEAGEVDERYFRGRSSLSNAVQAAQHFARVELRDPRISALAPIGVQSEDGEWDIRLAHAGATLRVQLVEALSDPLLSTCSATKPGRVREFRLTRLSALPAVEQVGT